MSSPPAARVVTPVTVKTPLCVKAPFVVMPKVPVTVDAPRISALVSFSVTLLPLAMPTVLKLLPGVGQCDVIRCACCKRGRAGDRYRTALGDGTAGGNIQAPRDTGGTENESGGIVVLDVAGRVGREARDIIRTVRQLIWAASLKT